VYDNVSLSLKAFLSHRYKSPEINTYFFNLFSENNTTIHFDVDLGSKSTNVTRLERMIRACDAFIGIYPYPGGEVRTPRHEELMRASPYFRLELDLAIRSGKPALVFYDRRYGGILRWSRNIRFVPFDSAEIVASSKPPSEGRFRHAFEQFRRTTAQSQAYSQSDERSMPTDVGILLPGDQDGTGYGRQELATVTSVLRDFGHLDLRTIECPPRLDRDTFVLLEGLDWALADVGDHGAASLVGYMHGQFIPTMRIKKSLPGARDPSSLEGVLYGGIEVGYSKDVIRWTDLSSLREGLASRLDSLRQGVTYISNPDAARNYFLEASRRKKTVFFSYAREDAEAARELAVKLGESFQRVFDYRDGQSLVPGDDWKEQIEREISKADLGIACLSEDYVKSINCREELRMMAKAKIDGAFLLYPIKLHRNDRIELSPGIGDLHWLRLWEYQDISSVAKHVIELFDDASRSPSQASENRDGTAMPGAS